MPEKLCWNVSFVASTPPSLPMYAFHSDEPGLQAEAISSVLSHRPEDRSRSTSLSIRRTTCGADTAASNR